MSEKWSYKYNANDEIRDKLLNIRATNKLLTLKDAIDFCINAQYEALERGQDDLQSKGNQSESR